MQALTRRITRRQFAALGGAALLAPHLARAVSPSGLERAIPASGERIPAVGLGTADVFNRNDELTQHAAQDVLQALVSAGGRLIDTASTYRDAELVIGQAVDGAALRERVFIATKVEAPDGRELERSLARLRTQQVDLLQLHNVQDPRQSLSQFRDWKAQGKCRYIGITSTYHNDFGAVEAVLAHEKPDFVQIDYSLDDRSAEARIVPLAADVGCAVLTALPFGRGRLFRSVQGREVPDWAEDFAGSWAQFFLKYLLGDERITAAIPGTSNPNHMRDNLGALQGRLPSRAERARMVSFIEAS